MSEFKAKHFFAVLGISILGVGLYATNKFGIQTTVQSVFAKLPF